MALPSITLPSITLPGIPSVTPEPDPSDSSTPGPTPSDPTPGPDPSGGSSGGPSSGGPSSAGPSSGSAGPSSGSPSSSVPPESSSASSTETTLSESSTSVFTSASLITSDGQTLTTQVTVTQVVPPGTVVSVAPASANSSPPVGPIVGGVIGGIVALLAIGALIWFLLKRKRNNFDKQFDGNFDPDYVSKHGTGPTAFAAGGAGGLLAGGAAAGANSHRKSQSLEKNGGRQRVNLNGADPSLEAALAEDDGMGGRLDASTVGGGIVTPFPLPQRGQHAPFGGQGYGQAPYNPAMSPPPMSMNSLPSPPPGQALGLGAAGAAGYYAGHHHQGQQPYAYGQQPYGQGYPDRHGAISPSTDGGTQSYPNSANPYLSGAASSSGHGAYGGYEQGAPYGGGVAPSITGTSVSGMGAFGGAAAALGSRASLTTSNGTGPSGGAGGPLSYTSGGMSAKEREARGMRPAGGLGVVNPDDQPEPRREGSGGSVLPSPFDANAAAGGSGGQQRNAKEVEAAANRNSSGALIQHQDGGRVQEDETPAGEIPPAYDAILYEQRK